MVGFESTVPGFDMRAETHKFDKNSESVSVLIPVLNGERFLQSALDSVILQSKVTEIVVVDNGSSDKTLHILDSYKRLDSRIKVYECPLRGISNALNLGLSVANGNFIARLDADDVMTPHRIELQMNLFRDNPEIVLLASQIGYIDEGGMGLGISKYPNGRLSLMKHFVLRNPIAHPSVIFKKEAALLAGGYNPAYEGAEDLDLWIRISSLGDIFVSSEILTLYRKHQEQVSFKNNNYKSELKLRLDYFLCRISSKNHGWIFSAMQLLRLIDLASTRIPLLVKARHFVKRIYLKRKI